MPKSVIFTIPSRVMRRFDGLMSRCTTSCRLRIIEPREHLLHRTDGILQMRFRNACLTYSSSAQPFTYSIAM